MTKVLKISFITLSVVGILILIGRVRDIVPETIASKIFTTIALVIILTIVVYASFFNKSSTSDKK